MLELLGLIGGGIFRLLPEVFGLFKAKRDADHEYRMTELQLKIDQARAQQAIDQAHAKAEIALAAGEMAAWSEALRAQSTPSGVKWIDALSASVRPVLTYWWCVGIYTSSKVLTIVVALQQSATLTQIAGLLMTDFDRGVISSMLAFWFVDRALKKLR